MDEDINAPDGVAEDVPVVDEQPAPAFDPETFASELGWSPQDKWRGDPEAWKPADEFLRETVTINKTQRRETKALKDELARISRATESIVERTRREERDKVSSEFRDAVEMGDFARAEQATAKLNQIEASAPEKAPPPTVTDFIDRNKSWFNVNQAATALAQAVCSDGAAKGVAAEQQLEEAEREVRKRFPELFPQARKGQAAVNEQQGRTARTGGNSRAKGFGDLPADAKAVALKFEKQGVKREAFAAEYWKENA